MDDFEQAVSGGVGDYLEYAEGSESQRHNRKEKTGRPTSASSTRTTHIQEARDEAVHGSSVDSVDKALDELLNDINNMEGGGDLGNPGLPPPEQQGNIFLQTGYMVAAILAALNMMRMASEMREIDRETRTEYTIAAANIKQFAAEAELAQKLEEATGQMIQGAMQIASGATNVVGSAVGMGISVHGARQAKSARNNEAKAAGLEQQNMEMRRNQTSLEAEEMATSNSPADIMAARNGTAHSQRSRRPGATSEDEARLDQQAQQHYEARRDAGQYEAVYEANGQRHVIQSDHADFDAIVDNRNLQIQHAGTYRSQATDTDAAATNFQTGTTNPGLVNDKTQADTFAGERVQTNEAKRQERLDNDQTIHANQVQISELRADAGKQNADSQMTSAVAQSWNGMVRGIGDMQMGIGQMINAAYQMEAAQLGFVSRLAQIVGDMMDSHMKIIDQDIEDFRDTIRKALDVLEKIVSVSNKSANMRG
jgi:hypothetical protein